MQESSALLAGCCESQQTVDACEQYRLVAEHDDRLAFHGLDTRRLHRCRRSMPKIGMAKLSPPHFTSSICASAIESGTESENRRSAARRRLDIQIALQTPDRLIDHRQSHASARQIGHRRGRGKARTEQHPGQFLSGTVARADSGRIPSRDRHFGHAREIHAAAVVFNGNGQTLAVRVHSASPTRLGLSLSRLAPAGVRCRGSRRFAADASADPSRLRARGGRRAHPRLLARNSISLASSRARSRIILR